MADTVLELNGNLRIVLNLSGWMPVFRQMKRSLNEEFEVRQSTNALKNVNNF
jgi:hypothetical protein